MGTITRYFNKRVIDVWEETFARVSLNQYESAALVHAFEAMEHLIDCRDAVDAARDSVRLSSTEGTVYDPTQYQQKRLFRAVTTFYDACYSGLSAWSGVVSRFHDVFGRTFANNTKLLAWFDETFPSQHDASIELERARAFRALLAHPQSFPPFTFTTRATQEDALLAVVLHGPYGRGERKIPQGASEITPDADESGGWQFEAPDEVSVTNCVSTLALGLLASVIATRTRKSAFAQTLTFDEAIELLESDMDVSASARSWHRIADLLGH